MKDSKDDRGDQFFLAPGERWLAPPEVEKMECVLAEVYTTMLLIRTLQYESPYDDDSLTVVKKIVEANNEISYYSHINEKILRVIYPAANRFCDNIHINEYCVGNHSHLDFENMQQFACQHINVKVEHHSEVSEICAAYLHACLELDTEVKDCSLTSAYESKIWVERTGEFFLFIKTPNDVSNYRMLDSSHGFLSYPFEDHHLTKTLLLDQKSAEEDLQFLESSVAYRAIS